MVGWLYLLDWFWKDIARNLPGYEISQSNTRQKYDNGDRCEIGIPCIASTTERIAEERDGQKVVTFRFVQFRGY